MVALSTGAAVNEVEFTVRTGNPAGGGGGGDGDGGWPKTRVAGLNRRSTSGSSQARAATAPLPPAEGLAIDALKGVRRDVYADVVAVRIYTPCWRGSTRMRGHDAPPPWLGQRRCPRKLPRPADRAVP